MFERECAGQSTRMCFNAVGALRTNGTASVRQQGASGFSKMWVGSHLAVGWRPIKVLRTSLCELGATQSRYPEPAPAKD
jgi:hypothetical protein